MRIDACEGVVKKRGNPLKTINGIEAIHSQPLSGRLIGRMLPYTTSCFKTPSPFQRYRGTKHPCCATSCLKTSLSLPEISRYETTVLRYKLSQNLPLPSRDIAVRNNRAALQAVSKPPSPFQGEGWGEGESIRLNHISLSPNPSPKGERNFETGSRATRPGCAAAPSTFCVTAAARPAAPDADRAAAAALVGRRASTVV